MCPPTTRSSSSTSAASLRSTCKPLNPCFPSTAYVLVASVAKGDQDFDRWVGVPQTKCFPPHTLNFLRVRSIYRKVNPSPTSSKVRLGISPAVMLGVRSVMYPISPIWWPSISTTYSAVSNLRVPRNHLRAREFDLVLFSLVLNQVGGEQVIVDLPAIFSSWEQR